ncbi:DUF4192 family protein [Nocardia sp. NPDC058518]|uniref:DUF4192 family protein n=1 Tax=Nocardia sp. NPDC058518 TaxID=3346534 RepID=UPI003661D139
MPIDPGRIFASIPALLCHRPTDYAITVLLRNHHPTGLLPGPIRRPEPEDITAITGNIARARADAIALFIVDDRAEETGRAQHHRDLAAIFAHEIPSPAAPFAGAWVAQEIAPGALWWSSDPAPDVGTIADPYAIPAAQVAAARGIDITRTLAEVQAEYAPIFDPIRTERLCMDLAVAHFGAEVADSGKPRADQLTDHVAEFWATLAQFDPHNPDALSSRARARVAVRLADPAVVAKLAALTDETPGLGEFARELARTTPGTYRIHALQLAAAVAYLAGDTLTAIVATDAALTDRPGDPWAQEMHRQIIRAASRREFVARLWDRAR